jgi:hypothetical protein
MVGKTLVELRGFQARAAFPSTNSRGQLVGDDQVAGLRKKACNSFFTA